MSRSKEITMGRGILDTRILHRDEHGDEETIARYVRNQGRKPEEYEKIYENKLLE
ncbi:hypothetical protein Holit_03033 [Hollandina sp. SP2]